ncbi:MAG: hypothetical protein ACI8T1_004879 [Verrucomicrobiales bacterium]|jgi:hypothetical protein
MALDKGRESAFVTRTSEAAEKFLVGRGHEK